MSKPLAATSVQMRNFTFFCLKASRLSRRSCGFRSPWRHTHENLFLSLGKNHHILKPQMHQRKQWEVSFNTDGIQVGFKIITVDFCATEDDCLVHVMFSYGPDAIFSF